MRLHAADSRFQWRAMGIISNMAYDREVASMVAAEAEWVEAIVAVLRAHPTHAIAAGRAAIALERLCGVDKTTQLQSMGVIDLLLNVMDINADDDGHAGQTTGLRLPRSACGAERRACRGGREIEMRRVEVGDGDRGQQRGRRRPQGREGVAHAVSQVDGAAHDAPDAEPHPRQRRQRHQKVQVDGNGDEGQVRRGGRTEGQVFRLDARQQRDDDGAVERDGHQQRDGDADPRQSARRSRQRDVLRTIRRRKLNRVDETRRGRHSLSIDGECKGAR